MIHDALIGRQLANFQIERLLGEGGMAMVYYGQDVKLQRPVAVKVIHPRYQGTPTYAQRFLREARTAAAWRHEHIIQIYYADEEEGLPYFVMEYIDGQDLGSLLVKQAKAGDLLPHTEVLRIGRAIARALDYAHAKGVVHRDIKPSNIFLAQDGRIVLGDFGLALELTQGSIGEIFGTPHYISPEQALRSSDAIPQSDLYSLGVILYEMLTGVVPFDDPSPTSVAIQHMTTPPPAPRTLNPGLNQQTEDVLLKALSKSPGDRYASGAELIEALQGALRAPAPAPAVADSPRLALPPLPAGIAAPPPVARPQPPLPPAAAPLPVAPPLAPPVSSMNQPSAPVVQPLVSAQPPLEQPMPPASVWSETPSVRQGTPSQEPVAGPTGTARLAAVQPNIPLPTPRARPASGRLMLSGAALLIVVLLAVLFGVLPKENPMQTSARDVTPTREAARKTATAQALLAAGEMPAATEAEAATGAPQQQPTQPSALTAGRRFLLHYDAHSFYLVNHSGETISNLASIRFERLSEAGESLTQFAGSQWPYQTIKDGRCSRIQRLGEPVAGRPDGCSKEESSIERNPATSGIDFWSPQDGSSIFRVLWQDQEVARCASAEGGCEIFLP